MSNDSFFTNLLKIFLHIGFFLSGITTVLIGQVLPILATKFSLNDEQTGNFFPAQFAGSVIGTLLSTWFGKRNKFLLATLIGCLLMGGGILMLNLGSYELCLLAFCLNGAGIGLTLPAINMLIFELNPHRAASALSFLNFFWGLGAIISQPFVDLLANGTDISTLTIILATTLFLVSLAMTIIPKEIESNPIKNNETDEDFKTPIWSNPIAWLIAGFNFIHVGYESAMGGWLKTYTQRIEDSSTIIFLHPILLYFVFFVVGRGVAPFFFRVFSVNKMLMLSLLTLLLGMGILLSANNIFILSLGASIAGFGTSSIFPTNMARFTKTFGPSASRRATPFFLFGTLGSAFTTWFIGYISTQFNSLHIGMFVLLGSCISLVFLQFILQRKTLKQV